MSQSTTVPDKTFMPESPQSQLRTRRYLSRSLIIILASLAIIITSFVLWANAAYELVPEQRAALQSDAFVSVVSDGWLSFTPVQTDYDTGLVLYPGGRVAAEAYAPLARAIAEEGYYVAIVYAPLNLAFFGIGAADEVIAGQPEVARWAVGGHSLGGVAASLFVRDNQDIGGLLLMATYPADDALSTRADLDVLSIYGTRDGVANIESIRNSAASLPPSAEFVAIEGANHAYFGWYGPQAGDQPATISQADFQAEVVQIITAWLSGLP